MLTVYDVSQSHVLVGIVASICVPVILYNAMQLYSMKKRKELLLEAKRLIIEGHERKLRGEKAPAIDKDMVTKEIARTQAKLDKSAGKKSAAAEKKKAVKSPENEAAERAKAAAEARRLSMEHFSGAYMSLENADRALAAANADFDPMALMDDKVKALYLQRSESANKNTKTGKNTKAGKKRKKS